MALIEKLDFPSVKSASGASEQDQMTKYPFLPLLTSFAILVCAAAGMRDAAADPAVDAAGRLDAKVFGGRDVEEFLMAEPRSQAMILSRFKDDRRETANRLMKVLAKRNNEFRTLKKIDPSSVEAHAVGLAGALKLDDMTGFLRSHIAVRHTTFELNPPSAGLGRRELRSDFSSFPMAVALKEIGFPAVKNLLTSIESTEDEHLQSTGFQLHVVTLEAILGKDLAEAALRQSADGNSDFSKRKLEAAIALIHKGEFGWRVSSASEFMPKSPKGESE